MEKKVRWMLFYLFTCSAVLLSAHLGSRFVTVMVENAPIARKHRVVIDAGHGGVDGGATSCTGVLEKDFNLQIALRLQDLFHLLGVETVMIRSTDISVYTNGETIAEKKISDLRQRVRMVEDTENPVLLSIHQNNFSDGRYSGAQVFFSDSPGSAELAGKLQSALISSLNPYSRRQTKKADGIYLMEHVTCPAVLIECGFLSNGREEALLRSKQYQQKLCCVIAATVGQVLSNT